MQDKNTLTFIWEADAKENKNEEAKNKFCRLIGLHR